jgi:hypothetical protein
VQELSPLDEAEIEVLPFGMNGEINCRHPDDAEVRNANNAAVCLSYFVQCVSLLLVLRNIWL